MLTSRARVLNVVDSVAFIQAENISVVFESVSFPAIAPRGIQGY